MFGRFTSSTYNPCPVSRRGSSLRLIRSPKYRVAIKSPNTNHYRWSSVPYGLRGTYRDHHVSRNILYACYCWSRYVLRTIRPTEYSGPRHCTTKRRFAAFELPREDAEGDAFVMQLLQSDIAAEVFNVDTIVGKQGIVCLLVRRI